MLTRLLRDWRPTWLDVSLSLAVGVVGLVESFGRQGFEPEQIKDPMPLAVGAVISGVLLLFRRRFPMTMLLTLTTVGFAVQVITNTWYYAAWHFYSTLILVHTVGSAAELRSRRGIAGLVCVLIAYGHLQTLPDNDVAEILIKAVFVGVAYTSGILLRRQTDRTTRLAERTTRLEMEREERARWAVTEERSRIARELHDIISHNVSLMTLHVGGVRRMLGDSRERERELLLGVEQAGREAVEELRLMLGMLRSTKDGDPLAPQPGLDRLDDLIAQVKEAGPEVNLRIIGARRTLPPGLDLSAYRLIQEALTNVLKHTQAAKVDVTFAYEPAELSIVIVNDGAGPGRIPNGGGGHGLIGMRERTAMHGGELSAGPITGGGYRVFARFPLGDPAEVG
ncbi:histidine kinase [Microtetraspora sp. NBRC 16547]|uniref:sensor histidine kinase n=1 Tax=Microtetraspora sp. NBRC 16547 TaxID=3030993 RepID=UPI0024A153DF|nr:histidine kinase [Microtetraspora sp. NBRC 16547]GLW99602.1 two-component sensor histidine kinase [Microtetraspora sp. NBRC 16547]